jgi:c-di-GMP-related signal transduction protein
MASSVAAQFIAGGKSLIDTELDQICKILNIPDEVKEKLPLGTCTYYLVLSTNAKLPATCVDEYKSVMKLVSNKRPE